MTNDGKKSSEGSACGCGGGKCGSGPGKWIWIVLILAVAGVLVAKNTGKKVVVEERKEPSHIEAPATMTDPAEPVTQGQSLPRLVDLGADKCIPCKMMAPILEDLKQAYEGTMDVQFIDVWKNPDAGEKYGINIIPTQIFFDSSGKELFRHEGFFAKEDILAKWKELGVNLPAGRKGKGTLESWNAGGKR